VALTEPQAGSSLSDLVTSAAPNADGTYSIRGKKIFISGGNHELAKRTRTSIPASGKRQAACGKLHACQWFFRWELRRVAPMLATSRTLDDTTLSMSAAMIPGTRA
jgi:hypothetical protein